MWLETRDLKTIRKKNKDKTDTSGGIWIQLWLFTRLMLPVKHSGLAQTTELPLGELNHAYGRKGNRDNGMVASC